MDLNKNGKLLCDLRKAKGMTQKQVADKLNICAKTVSKWETGHGFPDVSAICELSKILGVSSDTILAGRLIQNAEETGNMKKIKFYVCPECGNVLTQTGKGEITCCGKKLTPFAAQKCGSEHVLNVETIEDDFYITWNHSMTKEHYLNFAAYVKCDSIFIVRLYPEQSGEVRFPKLYGGKLYFCCNKHGLFEYSKL